VGYWRWSGFLGHDRANRRQTHLAVDDGANAPAPLVGADGDEIPADGVIPAWQARRFDAVAPVEHSHPVCLRGYLERSYHM
jgi:hypothetical protein